MKQVLTLLVLVLLATGCAKPPPPPPPPAPTFFEHKVTQSGETLGIIASWFTGSARNWKILAEKNPEIKPTRIKIGSTIRIPEELVKRRDPIPKKLLLRAQEGAASSEPSAPASGKPVESKSVDAEPAPESASPSVAAPEPSPSLSSQLETAEVAPTIALEPLPPVTAEEKARDDLIDEILNQ